MHLLSSLEMEQFGAGGFQRNFFVDTDLAIAIFNIGGKIMM